MIIATKMIMINHQEFMIFCFPHPHPPETLGVDFRETQPYIIVAIKETEILASFSTLLVHIIANISQQNKRV